MELKSILEKTHFNIEEIEHLLSLNDEDAQLLFQKAHEVRLQEIGNKVYMRGLIELSNHCMKDCFYCGIRRSNHTIDRYVMTDEEVYAAAEYAYKNNFGSIVIQGGELSSPAWVERIERLIRGIKQIGDKSLGITLSLGEQEEETYRRWFEAGSHRYLLRIETSDQELFHQIHPVDGYHTYERRLECLYTLKKIGYQVGTGVMIGLPGQTIRSLARDLLFMKEFDIDMCGMGPYIEHKNTPMYQRKHELLPPYERFMLSIKMVACLRLLMRDINIAATTAMETLHPSGRLMAFKAGANIVMPNITPEKYHDKYWLYENKAGSKQQIELLKIRITQEIYKAGLEPGFGQWGDSKHFQKRQQTH
ncbi:MAG: [FeFe] hydrogenase H-cluster radical SAM maturase HydE [Bacteroidales bacterium]|nr:[FeFe] hydrogenase H-cluster radical SAM maturase HydE [Bacteroidales bacterium]